MNSSIVKDLLSQHEGEMDIKVVKRRKNLIKCQTRYPEKECKTHRVILILDTDKGESDSERKRYRSSKRRNVHNEINIYRERERGNMNE